MGSADEGNTIVIYNGRAHYGDEKVFEDFEKVSGFNVELRGGTAPELFERLRREGKETPADVLVTTDLANLWRAADDGLLQPVTSPKLEANVPAELHDAAGEWWALSTRLRVPVVSTERVDVGAVTSYEDLGDPQYKGRLCLRTSNNEYNQSLVADMIAKRGPRRDREAAALVDGERSRAAQLRRRAARGDGGGRLRHRSQQPLLPRARARRGS